MTQNNHGMSERDHSDVTWAWPHYRAVSACQDPPVQMSARNSDDIRTDESIRDVEWEGRLRIVDRADELSLDGCTNASRSRIAV